MRLDAGDQYTGLDRFGRVVDQRWVDGSSGTAADRFQYGYDRLGNRLYRDNAVNSAFGEVYTYDGLSQLASFARGTLNGPKTGVTGTPARTQAWDYDAAGNWDGVTTGGVTEARTANAQNEVTSIGGLTTPTYDANGNTTRAETGLRYAYDAWNRLVAVTDSAGTTTLVEYAYDGLNRRVTRDDGAATDLYYSAGWQVVEEGVGGDVAARYVWSPVYVDALVLRDRDTDADGTPDERLWAIQDANWNVTAVADDGGAVQERYAYDPFGAATVYSPTWGTVRTTSSYDWAHLHQGGQLDGVTGNYHFRHRDYDPVLGRWINLDPIRFAAGDINQYRYVNNDPTNATDASGLLVGNEHRRFQGHIRDMVNMIRNRDISNCEGFAALIGLLYDINLGRRVGRVANPVQARADAFGETLRDALYYLTDHDSIRGADPLGRLDRVIDAYRSMIPEPQRAFRTPNELSEHGLGGLNQGYIQLKGDDDISGRHDHFLLNAAFSVTTFGMTQTEVGEIAQRLLGVEKSATDLHVNRMGRLFSDGGRVGRFANGRALAEWISSRLCDGSRCKRDFTASSFFPSRSEADALPAGDQTPGVPVYPPHERIR